MPAPARRPLVIPNHQLLLGIIERLLQHVSQLVNAFVDFDCDARFLRGA